MGYEYIYFTMKDSVKLDSLKIKDAYYIYTDLNKIFHYSWSFQENIRRMENRTGSLFLTNGDTINFKDINVLEDDEIRQGIKDFSDWPTIPQLYINGKFIGGCDIVKEMFENDELKNVLDETSK